MYRNSLTLFIALLTSVVTLQGQQLAVKSFRSLPNDMDARQNYPLKDQNGDLCAIVKVQTLEKGFYFDIGTLGIVKTEQKPGEIWVYMPHGAKRLTITHDHFLPLRDYIFTERIEQGVCYELVLASGRAVTTIVPDEIETQWLIITSDPAGADVFIDDQPAGVTPYQNLLPVGKHTYRLQKPLYQNDAGMVELVSGQQKKKIESKLRPNFGTVQVTTTPESGANVLLNGQETDRTTPCTLERVPAGQHTLSASLSMYATATQQITMQAGETLPVTMTLKPSFAGVTINTIPAADIYVNGAMKGNGQWQGRLNPGVYTFEARLDKHTSATEQRTVVIGEPLELTLQPEPRYGTLNVVTNPMDATIRMGGKDYGTTPNTIKNLLIGDYTVELSLPGYATAYEKVTITEGQTATVNATLQNGRQVTISSTPSGAKLSIDGQPAGTTPYNGSLTFGNHALRIEQDGKQAEKRVTISQTGGEINFSLAFGPQTFTETVNGVSFKMVAIKGGTFEMGSYEGEADEKPVHTVTVGDFFMGETEVTQALWKAVMGTNPSNWKGDNLPVEQVSWDDAQEFIAKLNRLTGKNYKLPTEAEWEYAAGGGSTVRTKWAGTNNESSLDNYGWYGKNSNEQTHSVSTKSPNGLGLYDMSGNVWEWCSDRDGSYSSGSQTNPQGSSSGYFRVNRGGSWNSIPWYCRVANRNGNAPGGRGGGLGFRVALAP